jgi:metal-responsive CopG/Arc/MetJ family transcriptional regulator
VQLPEDLLNRVDETVKHESLGYSSRAEFIKEAVRLRLEQLEKKLKDSTKHT